MSKFSDDDLEDFSRIGEIARLTALLAERDAEIKELKYDLRMAIIAEQTCVECTQEFNKMKQQLAERDAEIERLKLIEVVYRAIINNTHIAEDERLAKIIELTEQLAASQQECEELRLANNQLAAAAICPDDRLPENVRKQAAREIEQHLLSMFWTIPYKENEPMIYRDQAIELIRITFGLEG